MIVQQSFRRQNHVFPQLTGQSVESQAPCAVERPLADAYARLTAFFTDFAQEKQNGIGQRCEAVSILTDLQHLRRAQLSLSSEPHVSAIASTSIRESLLVRLKRATNEVAFLEDDWQDAPAAHLANR